MNQLQRYLRVFFHIRKVELMQLLEYRGNFFFWAFVSMMWTLFHIFFFALIVNVSQTIAGWSPNEMFILLAVFTIIDAFIWSFFYHTMTDYTASVFSGSLNQVLVRPIDPQFLIMIKKSSYTSIFRLMIGIGLLIWSVGKLHPQPSLGQILLFLLFLGLSLTFMYALWFVLSTLSFWVEKLDNINEIVPFLRRVYEVPAEVYTGVFSFILTVMVPLGLVSSLPSQILLNKASPITAVYFLIVTICLTLFSRWFFFLSLKKFSGVAN